MNPNEISLAHATWALVGVTLLLVAVTLWMARQHAAILREQSAAFRADLRARFQLTFIDRFDGPGMQNARKELADLFLSNAQHKEIPETVIEFFEDMGMFLGRGYLDEELIWGTFGFYAVRWWASCRSYVLEERKQQNDSTLFEDFEILASKLTNRDAKEGLAKPSAEDLRAFLEDEGDL